MSTLAMTRAQVRAQVIPVPRVLGTIALFASPAFIVLPLSMRFEATAAAAVLNLVFLTGWLCSAVGMRQLGVVSRPLFTAQLLGLALAATQEVQDLLNGFAAWDNMFYRISDAAWPLSVLFMLVIGFTTVRGGVWSGWRRRYTPVLCGLTLPVGILIGVIVGEEAMRLAMAVWFSVSWALLGQAIRTTRQHNQG